MQYRWLVLQDGRLPLNPDGQTDRSIEHVCTTTLVWPAKARLFGGNGLVVDPCFCASSLQDARNRLLAVGGSLDRVSHYFESHRHFDHMLRFGAWQPPQDEMGSKEEAKLRWTSVAHGNVPPLFPGIEEVVAPGHAIDLTCLRFSAADGEVWIVSDAILNRQWLTAWGYYWPNGYGPSEIVETWRSTARILATANVVIPGHGPPIRVDAGLLREVLDNFPNAKHSQGCPEVASQLRERYQRLLPGK